MGTAEIPMRYIASKYFEHHPQRKLVVWFVNGMNNNEETIQRTLDRLADVVSTALGEGITPEKIKGQTCNVSIESRRNNNFTAEEFALYSSLASKITEKPGASLAVGLFVLASALYLGPDTSGGIANAFIQTHIARIKQAANRVGGQLFDQLQSFVKDSSTKLSSSSGQPPLLVIVAHSHGSMCVESLLLRIREATIPPSSQPSSSSKTSPSSSSSKSSSSLSSPLSSSSSSSSSSSIINAAELNKFVNNSLIVVTYGAPTCIPDDLAACTTLRAFQVVHKNDEISFKQSTKSHLSGLHRFSADVLSLSGTKQEEIDESSTVITLTSPTDSPHSISSYFRLTKEALQ